MTPPDLAIQEGRLMHRSRRASRLVVVARRIRVFLLDEKQLYACDVAIKAIRKNISLSFSQSLTTYISSLRSLESQFLQVNLSKIEV